MPAAPRIHARPRLRILDARAVSADVAPMNGFLTYGRALAAAVVVTLVVAACGAAGSEEETPTAGASPPPVAATPSPAPTGDLAENARLARRGGVLVLANRGDPPAAFDPMRTSSIALHHPGGGLYGPGNLVFRCRENIYLVCPGLASDWTVSPDFTEWTFTLRSGAVWHDGEPFTGADVAFWFELARLDSTKRAACARRRTFGATSASPPETRRRSRYCRSGRCASASPSRTLTTSKC